MSAPPDGAPLLGYSAIPASGWGIPKGEPLSATSRSLARDTSRKNLFLRPHGCGVRQVSMDEAMELLGDVLILHPILGDDPVFG